MNKLILAIAAPMLFFSVTAVAQLRKIPAEVTEAFSSQYPAAQKVEWKDRLTHFNVMFELDEVAHQGTYSNKGEWQSTEHEITAEELPEAVTDGFDKSRYADWKVLGVFLIELPDEQLQYRIEAGSGDIKKRNLYFNEKGRLVKDKLTL